MIGVGLRIVNSADRIVIGAEVSGAERVVQDAQAFFAR